MTVHGPLRAQLAEQYVTENQGMIVGTESSPQSTTLMHSYLQFLTLRRIPPLRDRNSDTHPNPIDWQDQVLAAQLMRWADYTPSPYARVTKHRGELWPWKGDITVFDGGPLHPGGALGIYLNHTGFGEDAVWEVFTQGPEGPASTAHLPVTTMLPVGWWRVRDDRLARRGSRRATTSIPTITEVEPST